MELVFAIAIGLNPFVGLFAAAGLAAVSGKWAGAGPVWLLAAAALTAGAAVPVDLVLGYLPRFAARARRAAELFAPVAGALGVAWAAEPALPPAAAAALGAAGAWTVTWLVTAAASRASRSRAWVGLGHVPVLMGATLLSACLVPLYSALPAVTTGLGLLAVGALGWAAHAEIQTALLPRARASAALRLQRLVSGR